MYSIPGAVRMDLSPYNSGQRSNKKNQKDKLHWSIRVSKLNTLIRGGLVFLNFAQPLFSRDTNDFFYFSI